MNEHDSTADRSSQLFHEAQRILASARAAAALFLSVTAAMGTGFDVLGLDIGGILLLNLVAFVLGYYMTIKMLKRSGMARDGLNNGLVVYFGVALVSGIGISVGLLLIVIPGLILAVRWLPAYAIALVEGGGVSDALGRSWQLTKPHFWPLAICITIPAAVAAGGLAIYILAPMEETGAMDVLPALAANLLTFGSTVLFTTLGLSAFSLISRRDDALQDVFA